MPLYRAELQRRKGLLPPVLIHDLSQALYLPFDHDDGNKARDRSGYNNDGTILGATPVPGKVGGALSFNGVDNRIYIPDSPKFRPGDESFSFMCWLNSNLATAIYVWEHMANFSYTLRLTTLGKITFIWRDTATDYFRDSPEGVVSPGVWQHLAWVLDRSVDRIRFYRGGELVWDSSYSPALSLTGIQPVDVMRSDWWSVYCQGILDEVRFFNRVLSQAEIVRLMNMRGI